MTKQTDKWDLRYLSDKDTVPEPARVLKENSYLLPSRGKALDLACGRGGNALHLARTGLDVTAWDYSSVAIDKLTQHAIANHLQINPVVRDVALAPPDSESFDVIVVSYFLDRSVNRHLIEALRPGGLLFYQTFTRNKVSQKGPVNLDYLLEDNELLRIFRNLKIRVYREENFCGDTQKGLRNEALFVGQK